MNSTKEEIRRKNRIHLYLPRPISYPIYKLQKYGSRIVQSKHLEYTIIELQIML